MKVEIYKEKEDGSVGHPLFLKLTEEKGRIDLDLLNREGLHITTLMSFKDNEIISLEGSIPSDIDEYDISKNWWNANGSLRIKDETS